MISFMKSLSKNTILMIATAACTIAVAVGSLAIGFSLSKQNENVRATITTDQTLFQLDGDHNTALAVEFLQLAQQAHMNPTSAGGPTYLAADAVQIKAANGGTLPSVRLFQNTNNGDPDASSANTDTAFSSQTWRLVYISQENIDSDPVFTFIMEGAYRDQRFNPSSGTSNDYNTAGSGASPSTFGGTGGSELRNCLLTDFDSILTSSFINGDFQGVSQYIEKPRDLPGQWQTNQDSIATTRAQTSALMGDRLDDLVWIPSTQEIGDTNNISTPLWNLDQTEREYTQNGKSATSWIRSGSSTNATYARTMSSNGTFPTNGSTVTTANALRAAIHIKMSGLTAALPKVSATVQGTTGDGAGENVRSYWANNNETTVRLNAGIGYIIPDSSDNLEIEGNPIGANIYSNDDRLAGLMVWTPITDVCEYKAYYVDSTKQIVEIELCNIDSAYASTAMQVVAQTELAQYSINYFRLYGTTVPNETFTIEEEEAITLPEKPTGTRTGYRFVGWLAADSSGDPIVPDDQFTTHISQGSWGDKYFAAHWMPIWEVTLTSGTGYTLIPVGDYGSPVGDIYTVDEGTDFKFKIKIDSAYNQSEYKVLLNSSDITSTAFKGVYTISNITNAKEVEITGVELNEYSVTLTPGTGYTITPALGSSSPVQHGDNFSFKVVVLSSHLDSVSNLEIKINGVSKFFAPGTHTIKIEGPAVITVVGLLPNIYTVELPECPGGTWTASGSLTVVHGSNYTITITPNEGYTQRTPELLDFTGFGGRIPVSLGNNEFRIDNITGPILAEYFNIPKLKKNVYSVELPPDDVEYYTVEGKNWAVHGKKYEFKIILEDAYTEAQDTLIVQYKNVALECGDDIFTFVIQNITEPILAGEITVDTNIEKNKYPVYLPTDPEEYTITALDDTSAEHGSNFSFTVKPLEAYTESLLKIMVNGEEVGTQSGAAAVTHTIKITEITEITVVGAELNTYEATVSTGPGYTISEQSLGVIAGTVTVTHFDIWTLTINLLPGYTLAQPVVKRDGQQINPVGGKYIIKSQGRDFITGDFNITVSNVELNQYAVYFYGDHVAELIIPSQTITHGEMAEEPNTAMPKRYTFEGWFTNSAHTGTPFDFDTPIEEVTTLYGKWKPFQYTITFEVGQGASPVAKKTIDYGVALKNHKPDDPTLLGHVFDGWFKDEGTWKIAFDFEIETMPSENFTLHAKWSTAKEALWSAIIAAETFIHNNDKEWYTLDSRNALDATIINAKAVHNKTTNPLPTVKQMNDEIDKLREAIKDLVLQTDPLDELLADLEIDPRRHTIASYKVYSDAREAAERCVANEDKDYTLQELKERYSALKNAYLTRVPNHSSNSKDLDEKDLIYDLIQLVEDILALPIDKRDTGSYTYDSAEYVKNTYFGLLIAYFDNPNNNEDFTSLTIVPKYNEAFAALKVNKPKFLRDRKSELDKKDIELSSSNSRPVNPDSIYTEATWKILDDAFTELDDLLNNPNAYPTLAEVEAAMMNFKNALAGLQKTVIENPHKSMDPAAIGGICAGVTVLLGGTTFVLLYLRRKGIIKFF